MSRSVVALTGASGFIGQEIARVLVRDGYRVIGWVRGAFRPSHLAIPGVEYRCKDLAHEGITEADLVGVDTVIHAAAHAHRSRPTAYDRQLFRQINAEVTASLAAAARRSGVRRFVYLSSAGVFGRSSMQRPWTRHDLPFPVDPYAISKLAGEAALMTELAGSEQQFLILRPPLVLGLGAPGRLASLTNWIRRGLPVPISTQPNRRSVIAVSDLAELVTAALASVRGWGQVWLAADPEPISSAELARAIADGVGRSARLVSVPASLVRVLSDSPIFTSFEVDSRETLTCFNWAPRRPAIEAIKYALSETSSAC